MVSELLLHRNMRVKCCLREAETEKRPRAVGADFRGALATAQVTVDRNRCSFGDKTHWIAANDARIQSNYKGAVSRIEIHFYQAKPCRTHSVFLNVLFLEIGSCV